MYEPFVTDPPHRAADGMVHFTVEFRGSGLETIKRESFTGDFTEEWFKTWCKKQVDALNKPQEIGAISSGKVDLTGIVELDAERAAYEADRRRYQQYQMAAGDGINIEGIPDYQEIKERIQKNFKPEYYGIG